MKNVRMRTAVTGGLLLLTVAGVLAGSPGRIHAAERTVVGELFSADG